jgi:2',3'-cyclic-nucleotide 2'-phosphodiesterase (5'-nucleotidase family)
MERISSRWWNGVSSTLPVLALTATLLFAPAADARLLQILHTNDLHSYMEKSDEPGRGGYAAVKAVLERTKRNAASQGIDSVLLDAGDFSDGNSFFFADEGRQSWRVMDAMGYDAVTIGNHDFLVGPEHMERIARDTKLRTPFLAANMSFDKEYRNVRKTIRPYTEFERGGLRIAVLGVTTDELVYSFRMKDGGGIGDPVTAANRHLGQLRARNDLVLVLSHLGLKTDVNVVPKLRGVDAVIGGHSHSTLHQPLFVQDLDRKPVPIVQTGSHGDWVGRILVDVEPGQPSKLMEYELIPVHSSDGENSDGTMIRNLVAETRRMLERRYTPEWLYSTIGFTNTPIERPKDATTAWGSFFMETVRQTAKADLAVDPGEFHGPSQPAGMITPETLMTSYPRVFDATQAMGWTVWRIKVPGWMLQLLIDQVVKQGQHLNTAGLTFEVESTAAGTQVKNLKIQGKRVNWVKNYTMAVTEGIGRGTVEISFLLQLLFHPRDTGVPVWTALEKRLRSTGGDFIGASGSTPLGMIQ